MNLLTISIQVKRALVILLPIYLISACVATTQEGQNHSERPEWIDHAQSKYAGHDYLTAVGQATNRTRASKSAVSNLVEIFSVNIQAETKTLTEAVKEESALGVTMNSSSTLRRNIETKTDQAIQGVEIKESWLSPTGEYYALAVLQKRSAAQHLMESIMEMDNKTAELIDYSLNVAPNSILSINALRTARDEQITRKMADLQLTYISGSGILNDISSSHIEQLISQKLASLQVSVKAEEQKASLQAALSTLGIKVVEASTLQLSTLIDVSEPAYINGWHWLRGSYELTFTEQGKVISRKRWPVKVSAQQKNLLASRLKDKLNANMVEYLQQLMSDVPTF